MAVAPRSRFAAAEAPLTSRERSLYHHPHDWSWHLGVKRRTREEREQREGQLLESRGEEERIECGQRWTAVVAAMRTLVTRYNDGAGRQAVVMAENADGDQVSVTFESDGSGHTLEVELEETTLCIRARGGPSSAIASERSITFDRPDTATAGYILQPWMEQL
jgi:hypothetical protein